MNAIRTITPIESPSECHIYGDGDTAAKIVRILHEQVLPQTQEIPSWS